MKKISKKMEMKGRANLAKKTISLDLMGKLMKMKWKKILNKMEMSFPKKTKMNLKMIKNTKMFSMKSDKMTTRIILKKRRKRIKDSRKDPFIRLTVKKGSKANQRENDTYLN